MRIGSGKPALFAADLDRTNRLIARALERLSSGSRLLRPADAQGDFARAEKLEADRRAVDAQNRQTKSEQSLLTDDQNRVQSQINIVRSMLDVAREALNSNLTTDERNRLNEQIQGLLTDYRDLIKTSMWNGDTLFDSTASKVFTGTFDAAKFEELPAITQVNVRNLAFGDINGDGVIDMVAGTDFNSLRIRIGNGDGTFQSETAISTLNGTGHLELFDLNNDGNLDLVHTFPTQPVINIHLGNGDGTFDARTTIAVGTNPARPEFADINGDGFIDIVVPNATSGDTSIRLGNGDGTFTSGVTLGAIGINTQASIADLNRDGRLDIVLHATGNENVTIQLQQADGSFVSSFFSASGLGSGVVGVSAIDVNQDGLIDIVTLDKTANTLNVSLGNGTGTFAAYKTYSTGITNSNYMNIGDFNGDGVTDFVIGSQSTTDSLSILLGDGQGRFSVSSTRDVGNGFYEIATTDFNHDGITDLALANYDGDNISLLKGLSETRSAIDKINLRSVSSTQTAITVLENAIDNLMGGLANISAVNSRLDYRGNLQETLSEEYRRAQSVLEDIDIVEEITNLVTLQIRQQATIAAQAQGSLEMRLIYELLKDD